MLSIRWKSPFHTLWCWSWDFENHTSILPAAPCLALSTGALGEVFNTGRKKEFVSSWLFPGDFLLTSCVAFVYCVWLPVFFLVAPCLLPVWLLSPVCGLLSSSWCVCVFAQSCPTLCDSMDYNPPGPSIHGMLQARILEWVAISFSKGSSWHKDRTQVCFPLCHLGSPETSCLCACSCFSPWSPGFLPEVSESRSELGLRILRKGMGWLLSVYWVGEVRLILWASGIKLDTRTNHYPWGEKSAQGKTIRRASKTEGSTPFSLFLPFSLLSSLQLIKSNMAKKRYFSQSLSPISQSSTKKSRFRVERQQLTNWHKCFTK